MAQEIRYVAKSGRYENDGKSWATAKLNVQDAINDLYTKGLTGEVWVAQGTYSPTESTESVGGSTLYMSFKVYPGITVRGGFRGPDAGYAGENDSTERVMEPVKVDGYTVDNVYKYETILTGDLSQQATFAWDNKKQQWQTTYFGNCYHVVWFATAGFNDKQRALPLDTKNGFAMVEGMTIRDGNARNSDQANRYHTAYGGGVYMAKGSVLQNCIVENCEASRDGGGIYMDGGGTVVHCYVTHCQALGVSIDNGYGGGICLDANEHSIPMGVFRSTVVGNVAAKGGGMAIRGGLGAGTSIVANEYLTYAASVVVANNTATTEGGGVYTEGGAALSNLSIVRNRCNGSGVLLDDIVTGRAGGLYCRDHAVVFNSVVWGNTCAANHDVQYANSKSTSSVKNVEMKFCAVGMSDNTDWSLTTTSHVRSIMDYNNGVDFTAATGEQPRAAQLYPNFVLPTDTAGCHATVEVARERKANWQPSLNSCLENVGIVAQDINKDGHYPFTRLFEDILEQRFTSHATQGAYNALSLHMKPTLEPDGKYHFYVDPNAPTYRATLDTSHGENWDKPARYLANVLYCIKNHQAHLSDDEFAGAEFVVHVKQGKIDNTDSYSTVRVRNVKMYVPSNVTILGGYPSALTDTLKADPDNGLVRNPLVHLTVLTGDLLDNYDLNTSHMLVLHNVKNVVIDGVQVRNINARSRELGNDTVDGGALNIVNCENVEVRNVLVAGCTAERGAAVLVHDSKGVRFENCIFHNNDSRHVVDGGNNTLYGNVEVGTSEGITGGEYQVEFSHCNFMNNVGYGLKLYGGGTAHMSNSMLFGNTKAPIPTVYYETEGNREVFIKQVASAVYTDNELALSLGQGMLYDEITIIGGKVGTLSYLLNKDNEYPRFVNGVINSGPTPAGDMTFYGRATSFMPHNLNPMTNGGRHDGSPDTWGKDITTQITRTYGGLPDVGAVENYASTEGENAYPGGQATLGDVVYVRAYPNEAHDLKTGDFEGYDGSSWQTAIDGNANYAVAFTHSVTKHLFTSTPTTTTVANANNAQAPRYRIAMNDGSLHYAIQGDDVRNGDGQNYIKHDNTRANGDLFIFIAGTEDRAGAYQIYNVTRRKYVIYTNTNNAGGNVRLAISRTADEDTSYWYLRRFTELYKGTTENVIIIPYGARNDDDPNSWNYHGGLGNNLGLYPGWDDPAGKWVIETENQVTTTETTNNINGLQYAIYLANQKYNEQVTLNGGNKDGVEACDVYVGAGTYTYTDNEYSDQLEMREGANVLGAFYPTGTPGINERRIDNDEVREPEYITILQPQTTGNYRVLTQPSDFDVSTMFEGFIIENGRTSGSDFGAGAQIKKNGVLKNCLVRDNRFDANSSSPWHSGGAGIYISDGGLVKNCVIENNLAEGNGQGKFVCGAGVFMDGGTFQNSLIVRNTAHNTGYNVLGAAIYVRKRSQFYNCTIAYNYGDTEEIHPATGGVWDAAATQVSGTTYTNYSTFYNCIVWGNYANGTTRENLVQVGMSGYGVNGDGGRCYDAMNNCYSSAANKAFASDHDTDPSRVRNFKTNEGTEYSYALFLDSCMTYQPFVGDAATTDFSLRPDAKECVNMGANQALLESMGITEDIVGSPRVLDCTVDKGAYEFKDSYAIQPNVVMKADGVTVDETQPATFYVTPKGRGLASAQTPANAACAAKLQRVLDAAGRYKYLHPDQQVIVKVGTYADGTDFQYYATRSTDHEDLDVRVWSIIVPRGVEVWGGYTDAFTSDTDNGFYTTVDGVTTDHRDITAHETRFDSYYYSTDQQTGVHTYHVVTFTDKVFDGEGMPYAVGNDLTEDSGWKPGATYMSMGEHGNVGDRAVLDGIFITGGRADLRAGDVSTSANININSYGGAAIVTDYAHVRNCIVRDNTGIYGGALALTHNALVTGCLLDRNSAEYGGAIYVFKDGAKLSNNITVASTNEKYDASVTTEESRYDYNMSHVLSTTIVNNEATVQGGGVWFNDNVRFHGVVVWQNRCQDQANVCGQYNAIRSDGQDYFTTEYYPFNYSAIQGISPSGINNISAAVENKYGMRFYSVTKGDPDGHTLAVVDNTKDDPYQFDDFGYFAPIDLSILSQGGIPMDAYNKYVTAGKLSTHDFLGVARNVSTDGQRLFIEIGALASEKKRQDKRLMLRLFVAKPSDIDPDAMLAMYEAGEGAAAGSAEEYYSQEGSSFAYPFQRLQDALDYIYRMRGHDVSDSDDTQGDGRFFRAANIKENANNMAFQIWMGPGTYLPSVDLSDNHKNTIAHTFLIPEGVTIVGGHNPYYACDADGNEPTDTEDLIHVMGAYSQPMFRDPAGSASDLWQNGDYDINGNSEPIEFGGTHRDHYDHHDIAHNGKTYRIHQVHDTTAHARREMFDINANTVLEPWEMRYQTILSGKAEGNENFGVGHVVSILANQEYVGALPYSQGEDVFSPPAEGAANYGYVPTEAGQRVLLDGITITGGYAYGYRKGSVDDNHKMKFNHGGAILLDGNRYNNRYNHKDDAAFKETRYMYPTVVASAGYRHIPLMLSRCKFENNMAGYGGAISTNGTLDVVNSSFERNMAMAGLDTLDITVNKQGTPTEEPFIVKYPGAGGAIYGTYQVSAINTMFENNEADGSALYGSEPLDEFTILSKMIADVEQYGSVQPGARRTLYYGSGGAVFLSTRAQFHFMNCNFVRNQAFAYPAIYTSNPNCDAQVQKGTIGLMDYNQAFNTVFWGNDLHPRVKASATPDNKIRLNRVVNFGASDRGTLNGDGTITLSRYDVRTDQAPADQDSLDREENETVGGVELKGYTEQLWFSAYEQNRGKTPQNNLDLREFVFDPRKHTKKHLIDELARMFKAEAVEKGESLSDAQALIDAQNAYQNCNILLDSQNNTAEGPNFTNPSQNPGYAGYVESADWSPARLCNLTDNGWGKVVQTVSTADNINYSVDMVRYTDDAGAYPLPTYPVGRIGADGYSSEAIGDYVMNGAYPTLRSMRVNEKYSGIMPLGFDEYMYNAFGETIVPMLRISLDPNPTQNQTFVDIGVYEYCHVPLQFDHEGDEVDILWVSPVEKLANGMPDGSSWAQPTSDMQRAIETLLSSRNGHRKEIRLLNGTISPIYTIEGKLSFYIDTERLNTSTMLPLNDAGNAVEGLGVKSLTIKGGYSQELPNVHSADLYPIYIRQQDRSGGTSDKWNHLFYIEDATQRYGATTYNEENGYGHLAGGTAANAGVYTFPIHIDGVRLINDQALPGTQGAAIHYAPLDPILTQKQGYVEGADVLSTPANVSTGSRETEVGGITTVEYGYATVEKPAKLILSKTHILGSGAEGDTNANASAVYLGNTHGHAILYNNVLHSNHVAPIEALCRAVTVNNTYALNGGPVKLRMPQSTLHNSVMWRNTVAEGSSQYLLAGINYDPATKLETAPADIPYTVATAAFFSRNAYTGGPYENLGYNETLVADHKNWNAGLSDVNSDVLKGPNFVDWDNSDLTLRDFRFVPTLRLMNQGEDERYDTLRVNTADLAAKGSIPVNSDPANMLYDLAVRTSYYEDAASNVRFRGKSIDLGAYEIQNDLRRIFYINPQTDIQGTGESWANPIGRGGIQNAINMAALYHASHPTEQAFVFIKGAMQGDTLAHTGESITLLNGVSIYGGINSNLLNSVVPLYEGSVASYTDEIIQKYIDNELMEMYDGYVGPNTYRTVVSGIRTNESTMYNTDVSLVTGQLFHIASTIEGVHVTNTTPAAGSVIDVTPNYVGSNKPLVALRSIAVYKNTMDESVAADVPVANVENALVYNSIFHTNDAGHTTLRLGDGAYALNVSAQGKTETLVGGTYVAPFNGYGNPDGMNDSELHAKELQNRIIYSIVNYAGEDGTVDEAVLHQTRYTLSGNNYRRSDRNMYFQLTGGSRHVNEIPILFTTENPLGCEDILPKNLQCFVNYQRDRDILGNPRVLSLISKDSIAAIHGSETWAKGMHVLDRGCYEAWMVDDEVVFTQLKAPTELYAHHSPIHTHYYPHTGSAVYVNDKRNLLLGAAFQPGFMLLKPGASMYGQGQDVKISYLAIEREVGLNGAVVSMPFDMDYRTIKDKETNHYVSGVTRPYYEDADGNVTDQMVGGGVLHMAYDPGTSFYDYAPGNRMSSYYDFSATSGAWLDSIMGWEKPRNHGLLMSIDEKSVRASGLYDFDEGATTTNAASRSRLIYRFTARGEKWDDYVYTETSSEKWKDVSLTQYDDVTPGGGNNAPTDNGAPNPTADFTSKENMGWNCTGVPYLVSDYRTFNEAEGSDPANVYAQKAGMAPTHYNMHLPRTMWLYYDGVKAADGSNVDGDGGFYSVPSWTHDPANPGLSWHLPAGATPRLWAGEGLILQTASVTGNAQKRFYRPVYMPQAGGSGARQNTRYYMDESIEGDVEELDIHVHRRTVTVRGLQGGEQIGIYDLPGRCYNISTAREQATQWTYVLPHPGIYIINVDGLTRKVMVK